MFVITNDNNVIYGPAGYNLDMFNYVLTQTLGISNPVLPFTLEPSDVLVIGNTKILPANLEYPVNFNPKIHQYSGPTWVINESTATGVYTIAFKQLDQVKNELLQQLAINRFKYETSNFNVLIQNISVSVLATRENKMIIANTYVLTPDNASVNWKFEDNIHLTLSKQELGLILQAVYTQTQKVFDWEAELSTSIKNCSSLEELDTIDIDGYVN